MSPPQEPLRPEAPELRELRQGRSRLCRLRSHHQEGNPTQVRQGTGRAAVCEREPLCLARRRVLDIISRRQCWVVDDLLTCRAVMSFISRRELSSSRICSHPITSPFPQPKTSRYALAQAPTPPASTRRQRRATRVSLRLATALSIGLRARQLNR